MSLAIALALSMLILSCGGDSDDGQAANTTDGGSDGGSAGKVQIGVLAPLSGDGASYGVPEQTGWELYAEKLNEEGGLQIGDKRYEIEIVSKDSRWDAAVTKNAVESLINEQGINFISVNGDPQDPILIPVSEQNGTIVMDYTANKEYLSPPYERVFNYYPSSNVIAGPWLEAVTARHPDIKSIYHVAPDLQFGRNNVEWTKEVVEEMGLENAGETFYDATSVNFSPVLSKAVQSDPDLITVVGAPAVVAQVVKTLRELDYDGVIGGIAPGQSVDEVIQGAGDAAEGFYQAEFFTYPLTDAAIELEEKYQEATGGDWSPTGIDYWLQAKHFFESLKAAGTIDDLDAIVEALESTSITNEFAEGEPEMTMGGMETYGQLREMQMTIALNTVSGGETKTEEVLDVMIP